jgi:hypothetical protein
MESHIQNRRGFIHLNHVSNNIEEYELEKELHREKQMSNNDEITNDSILDYDKNGILDFITNFSQVGHSIVKKRYDNIVKIGGDNENYDYKIKINFNIHSNIDILQAIYLIIEFDDINDYENKILTSDFLNSQIKFIVGSKKLFDTTILMCILESKLKGYEPIIEYDKIQIPLFIFDFQIPFDNENILTGLTMLNCYVDKKLNICTTHNLKYLFENITMKGLCIDTEYRNYLGRLAHCRNILLESEIHTFTELENYTFNVPIKIGKCEILKAVVFVFYPKYEHTCDIELTCAFMDNLELNEKITKIKLLNTNIYVLSFSKEFDNIENMQNLFKFKGDYITDEGISYNYTLDDLSEENKFIDIFIDTETSDDMKDYNLDLIKIHLGFITIEKGFIKFMKNTI